MKRILSTTVLVIFSAMILAIPVSAATVVSFSPANIKVVKGKSFNIVITVNAQNIKNYTDKIVLNYPANLLEVKSFSFGNSWMPLNQSGYDLVDNTNGTLIKTAGYPGGISSTATFGTVSFLTKKTGNGVIKIGDNTLILDANNKNVLSGTAQTSFVVNASVVKKQSKEKVSVKTTPQHKKELQKKVVTTKNLTSTKKAKGIVAPKTEGIVSQQSLVASLIIGWNKNDQINTLIVIIITIILTLVYFGFKEWKFLEKIKRKK